MQKPKEKWILVADSERARLLVGTLVAHGRIHLDEMTKLETTFVAGEHHRPSQLAGRGHSAHASFGHEHEEKLAHFARELAAWVEKELAARKVDSCALFAPARFLGALRKELKKPVAQKLSEHEGEITKLSPGHLVEHPAVAAELSVLKGA